MLGGLRRGTDRVRIAVEARLERFARRPTAYAPVRYADAVDALAQCLQLGSTTVSGLLPESVFEDEVRERLRAPSGIERRHDGDAALVRLLHLLCRAMRPSTVMETGVGRGVTSAFVLQALHLNAHGHLWSIDLPPRRAKGSEQGIAVPRRLHERWCLVVGSARRELPRVLSQAGALDLFVHDSLHTRRHMLWEFETAWTHLRPRGWIVSDDVEGNDAFFQIQERAAWSITVFQSGKLGRLIGLAMKPDEQP